MREQITATLNGQALIDLRVELRRGGRPSEFTATMAPSASVQPGPVTLHVADVGSQRTFGQFTIRSIEALGDGRVRVRGSDLRANWQGPVSVEINVPVGDGTAWGEGYPLNAQRVIDQLFVAGGLDISEAPRLPGGAPTPVNVRASGDLGRAVEATLGEIGLTITVDDEGLVVVVGASDAPVIESTRLIEMQASRAKQPASVSVTGGAPLQIAQLDQWESVLPDDDGAIRPLNDVLAEWGISATPARQACLSDGGFERLLSDTGANGAERLATLKRFAFRLFRASEATLPWLPVGGVNEDGSLKSPLLQAIGVRPKGTAPRHPLDANAETTTATPVEGFELDPNAGLVYLPRPPFALTPGSIDDPTMQDRTLQGDASLSLRIAHASSRPPFTLKVDGGGDGEPVSLHAPHLIALYDAEGALLNRESLQRQARVLGEQHMRERLNRVARIAGVSAVLAGGTCDRVVITAGANGLTTTITDAPVTFTDRPTAWGLPGARSQSSAPIPSGLHQPINAYRAGPLVLLANGETPEGESVLGVEAVHRSIETGALQLRHPGPLAFPFFLESGDTAKFGRWLFVAGVEVAASGLLRVLGPDERHEEIPAQQLFEARRVLPQAMRGLIVSLGGEPRFVDTGPLVSDSRGREPGETSSLVYDLDGKALSQRKRGGLQFLTVLVLSPAHKQEGARDGGWVPALNLREGDTSSPEVLGRGLFAEGDGRALGRLAATLQGGPILADPDACIKHRYGQASDDGLYRESAGHVSTEAFFKVPGDRVHDAPIKFYAQAFEGGVPPWTPYEAQLKYDASERHPWNHKQREGRWKIQYRLPFLPEIPPTWRPPIGPPPAPPVDDPPVDDPPGITVPRAAYARDDIRPAISDHNLWAPSFDWLPAPSQRDSERESPFTGPSIKSEGWSAEPDPSLGGGCIYLPPGVAMPAAQSDSSERQTFLALHPEVVLAFGHPDFASGRVHSGWDLRLATAGQHLEMLPRDALGEIALGLERGVHISGHMQLGPSDTSFGETQVLRLGSSDTDGIAFGDDVELYRDGEATLRTDADFEVGGKLTVEGLIDPTGLELAPQVSNPGGVAANTLWLDSGNGNRAKVGTNRLAYSSEVPSTSGFLQSANNLSDVASAASARANLGLGALALLGSVQNGNWSGTDLSIANGGTGASTARDALANLGTLKTTLVPYTGNSSSGHQITLTGINRAYLIVYARLTGNNADGIALPIGGTGTLTRRRFDTGSSDTALSLDAPGTGTSQKLTINTTDSAINGSGVSYALLVIGTST